MHSHAHLQCLRHATQQGFCTYSFGGGGARIGLPMPTPRMGVVLQMCLLNSLMPHRSRWPGPDPTGFRWRGVLFLQVVWEPILEIESPEYFWRKFARGEGGRSIGSRFWEGCNCWNRGVCSPQEKGWAIIPRPLPKLGLARRSIFWYVGVCRHVFIQMVGFLVEWFIYQVMSHTCRYVYTVFRSLKYWRIPAKMLSALYPPPLPAEAGDCCQYGEIKLDLPLVSYVHFDCILKYSLTHLLTSPL